MCLTMYSIFNCCRKLFVHLGFVFLILQADALLKCSGFLKHSIYSSRSSFLPQVLAMSEFTVDQLTNMVHTALSEHQSGNLKGAIDSYEAVLPHLSGTIKASLSGNVGALYMNQGDYEKARHHFQNAVQADEANPSSHYNLAVILTSNFNEHGLAIRHCGTAIKLDENNYKAHHLMGNILQNIGRPKAADKYFVMAENIARLSAAAAPSSQYEGEARGAEERMGSTGNNVRGKSTANRYPLQSLPAFNASIGDVIAKNIDGKEYRLECISEQPLAFMVANLITAEECAHIRQLASSRMERSFVMGGTASKKAEAEPSQDAQQSEVLSQKVESGAAVIPAASDKEDGEEEKVHPSLYRSSYTAWLPQDDALNQLQRRLSFLLDLSLPYLQQQSEQLQVVRYPTGGQFKVHQDSSAFNSRLLTALLYLSSPQSSSSSNGSNTSDVHAAVGGGQTWFPYAGESGLPRQLNAAAVSVGAAGDSSNVAIGTVDDAVSHALSAYESYYELNREGTGNEGKAGSTIIDGGNGKKGGGDFFSGLAGLKIEPRQGSAVVFFNHDSRGAIDPFAVHAGLPVIKAQARVTANGGGVIAAASASHATEGTGFVSDGEPTSSSAPYQQQDGETSEALIEKWVANYWVGLDTSSLSKMLPT